MNFCKFLMLSCLLAIGLPAIAQSEVSIYESTLRECRAGKTNLEAAVRDFQVIKDQSVDTWLAMMGDAEKAADMIRTRGMGSRIHQNLTSPEFLRAVQDCHPDSPALQWLYLVSDAALAYEGAAVGTGLIVLTFYFPTMLLSSLQKLAPFIPIAARAGWLRMLTSLRFGLYGLGIYVVYELVMLGRESYLNQMDPARPVLITMQRSLDAAISAERERLREKLMAEYRVLRGKLSRPGPTYSEREVIRERYLVIREALFKLNEV